MTTKGPVREAAKKRARDGKVFGRTKSRRKENVAVYCDAKGETRVEVWTIFERRGSLRMSLSAARVLRRALNCYLESDSSLGEVYAAAEKG